MSFFDDDDDEDYHVIESPDFPKEDVLEHVFDNYWGDVLDRARPAIAEERAARWRDGARFWLRLINCVGEGDKEHSRRVFRRWVEDEADILPRDSSPLKDEVPNDAELFEIASSIAAILEEEDSPYSEFCKLGDDLSWIRDTVSAARSIRHLIITLAEPALLLERNLAPAVKTFNSFLTTGAPREILIGFSYSENTKRYYLTAQGQNPELTPLHSAITQSMAEYFDLHREALDLAVCSECSHIFERNRRDNAYCSKTCQNRVAYKRKRMIDSGFLAQLPTEPATVKTLRPGLWVNHPRWGLGVVEKVQFTERRLLHHSGGTKLLSSKIGENESVEEAKARLSEIWGSNVWEEVRDEKSLEATIRYLSSVVRTLSWSEFFGDADAKSHVAILKVKNSEGLLRML